MCPSESGKLFLADRIVAYDESRLTAEKYHGVIQNGDDYDSPHAFW